MASLQAPRYDYTVTVLPSRDTCYLNFTGAVCTAMDCLLSTSIAAVKRGRLREFGAEGERERLITTESQSATSVLQLNTNAFAFTLKVVLGCPSLFRCPVGVVEASSFVTRSVQLGDTVVNGL